jgi:hypothetical protein
MRFSFRNLGNCAESKQIKHTITSHASKSILYSLFFVLSTINGVQPTSLPKHNNNSSFSFKITINKFYKNSVIRKSKNKIPINLHPQGHSHNNLSKHKIDKLEI